jgi:NACalpha-BTF3-like transcription factor
MGDVIKGFFDKNKEKERTEMSKEFYNLMIADGSFSKNEIIEAMREHGGYDLSFISD